MLLAHRDLGGEGKPPLVILHGLLGSSRNWQTAGRDLSAGFHVLAPDLRNHGTSFHSEEMTYPAMMGDVLGWLDAMGLGRVLLLGHSLGGKAAMLLACRRPERVERLVVVDIAPRAYHWPERRDEFAAMEALDLGSLTSRAEAERLLEPRVHGWAHRKFLLTNLERLDDGRWRWSAHLPALREALPGIEGTPLGPADRYAGPALFIAGGGSPYAGPGDRDAIIRHFPSARLETIPESGHNPHMESRRRFVELVTAFLTRVSGTSAESPPAPPTR